MSDFENARKFDEVSLEIWKRMLVIAKGARVEDGGMLDPRMGAINVWSAPDDRPEGQLWKITAGGFPKPREFHSSLYARIEGDRVTLLLEVSNYGAQESAQKSLRGSPLPYASRKTIVEKSFRGDEADWKWAEGKFRNLIARAQEGDGAGKEPFERHIVRDKDSGQETEMIGL